MTPQERFWAKVDKSAGPDGCWLWTASRNEMGYGNFWLNRRLVRAHRYSLELAGRLCPANLVVDHLCRTPACVNPEHLEPVTNRENTRRGRLIHAEKTHCPQGHAYDEANTQWRATPRGRRHRGCRECQRQHKRRLRVKVPRKRKTHCAKGHEYTPENTQWAPTNTGQAQVCRECKILAKRRRRAEKKRAKDAADPE